MKSIKTIFVIIAIIISQYAVAQTDSVFQLVKTITTNVAGIAVDNLDNIYILTSTGQLKKLDSNGDSLAVYNNVKRYGKLYSVDVTNPLKLLLFYKDFSTLVLLDRQLSVRTTIDLRRYNILQASAVALSYDNNIWVFDSYNNKLKKINEEGNLLLETPDFRMLFNTSVVPQQIIDQNGLVYIYDTAQGIYAFDYYGTFKRKIPITGWTNIRVINNTIFGMVNHTIQAYDMNTLLHYQQPLPAPLQLFDKYMIGNNKLYATGNNTLSIYSYRYIYK